MALHKPFLIPVSLILMLGATACNLEAAGAVPAPGEPTATSPAPQTVGQCSNPLQPVIAGARWDYSMSGITGGKFTRTITEIHSDGFTDQDVFDSGVTRTGEWKCEQGTLIALSPAEGMSGIVQTAGMTAEFKTTSSSGVTLPAIVRPGDSWTQSFTLEGTQTIGGTQAQSKGDTSYSCKAAGTETVVVPAGTFDAVRVGCQINGKITVVMSGVEVPTDLTSAATIWYARGVGMVKTENEISGIGHSTIELTSYTIP